MVNEISGAEVSMSNGNTLLSGWRGDGKGHYLNETLEYARLLDEIFNTYFQEQLFQEIQDIYIRKERNFMPVYKNLMFSLTGMIKEYDRTVLDFYATETTKRKQFYSNKTFEPLEVPSVDKALEDVNQNKMERKKKSKEGKEK